MKHRNSLTTTRTPYPESEYFNHHLFDPKLSRTLLTKGWLAVFLLFILSLPVLFTEAVYAEPATPLIDSKHLWFSPDQKAMKAFNAGDYGKAAEKFTRPEWQSSAFFRKGDYQSAINAFYQIAQDDRSSSDYYNKANALAKLGQFEQAIEAYDNALELNQNNDDARYNREQVKQHLEKQQNDKQQDSKQQDGKQQNKEQQNNDEKQNGENQSGEKQQDSAQQNSDQQQQGEQQSEQTNQQPGPDSEQQERAENEPLQQYDADAEAKKQQAEMEAYQQQQEENESQQGRQDEANNAEAQQQPPEIEVSRTQASITEDEKAAAQWLKRIPDDPGGLLRRKFYYQSKINREKIESNEPW